MIHKYILGLKLMNQVSFRKNAIWRFLPLSRIANYKYQNYSRNEIITKYTSITGDFNQAVSRVVVDKEQILRDADNAIIGKFDFLGSGLCQLNHEKWFTDFKSGYTWKVGRFYTKQREGTPLGADVKMPWELSRCHHLLWCGEAYLLTKDEKYAQKIVSEISDWIEENPLMYSVNWVCSMDVAIRAINWIYAISMIKESISMDDNFVQRVHKSLYQHGFFIWHNLEKNIPYSNNHYSSDIVGLLLLGKLFNSTKRGTQWYRFALDELYADIRTQILPSGVHYERSISYHRLMVELYSLSFYMLKRTGVDVPLEIEYRIRSMYRFIRDYTKPNGLSPVIEDNDDGRILPCVKRDFRDHRYLLDAQSVENLVMSAGVDLIRPLTQSTSYEDAGFGIDKKGDAFLMFTNGGHSKYCVPSTQQKQLGSHTHNDHLSFELSIGTDDIIIDPGSYLYTSDVHAHNEFRSTAKHNTIMVDEEEQNVLSKTSIMSFVPNVIIRGTNEYHTINGKLSHKRFFILSDGELIITDYLEKAGKDHVAKIYFHFAEGVKITELKKSFLVSSPSHKINMVIESDCNFRAELKRDTISPSFGILRNSQTLVGNVHFNDSTKIVTSLKW